MLLISRSLPDQTRAFLATCLLGLSLPVMALESDRQESLEVSANSTDGTLGDGVTTLRGNVDIRQGTLRITADEAEVKKIDGRVGSVTFRGKPAFLEQEIEEQGLVQATANVIDYQVASGLVTLTGSADVKHPQYQISGEVLTYDLNIQHFQGSSDENGKGRIHILLDPAVINSDDGEELKKDEPAVEQPDAEAATIAAEAVEPSKDGN
jgi:lipopolysaccharide export system protein LptA